MSCADAVPSAQPPSKHGGPWVIVDPPEGKLDLADKSCPVFETPDPLTSGIAERLVYTRARIDISAFKNKVVNLPPEIWEDENQEGNVHLMRPSHDRWGVKKIVFNFCDDFLLKVLDLPWSRDPEWRTLLKEIYSAIGVDESKVVRSLLARMPPNMDIPVHHDTGYWVKHTHRIHVPIVTDSEQVDFIVGPTPEAMKKYLFNEGSIIELNNQAKHAVYNRMHDTWRIHLIFDYVEDHPVNRYLLKPGDIINQTRRSLDLASEVGSRPAPSFIIIGAQKSGTTSLYEYLCQHPLVVRGKRRETHYFDWRWNSSLKTPEEHHVYYMNFFEKDAMLKYPSLMTGESTPSYLLHSDIVIKRILDVCPHVQLLVMLRDPVARAYSQFQMSIDTGGTDEQKKVRGLASYASITFEEAVERELQELADIGIKDGASVPYEVFKDRFLSTRPMNHGGHSLLARGLYALQLEPWFEAFPENRLRVNLIGDIKGSKQKVQTFMDGIFSFVGLPPNDVEDLAAKNTRDYTPMGDAVRAKLQAFYAPYNSMLSDMLVKRTGHPLDMSKW